MQASGGVAWFVQVSDIHLSRYAVEQMPQFGDKEGDWGYFASNILRPLAPGALLLTGDLVDGKTKLMRGAQDAGEWQVGNFGLWLTDWHAPYTSQVVGNTHEAQVSRVDMATCAEVSAAG
jgi:hypothetical protein